MLLLQSGVRNEFSSWLFPHVAPHRRETSDVRSRARLSQDWRLSSLLSSILYAPCQRAYGPRRVVRVIGGKRPKTSTSSRLRSIFNFATRCVLHRVLYAERENASRRTKLDVSIWPFVVASRNYGHRRLHFGIYIYISVWSCHVIVKSVRSRKNRVGDVTLLFRAAKCHKTSPLGGNALRFFWEL